MKYASKVFAVLALMGAGSLLSSCESVVTTPESSPSAISHFYPLKNGAKYTYSRFSYGQYAGTVDTETYQIAIGLRPSESNRLVLSETNSSPRTLYNFSYNRDNGVESAILWDSTFRHIVLKGDLRINSSWVADPITNTEATVVDHYQEYFLTGMPVSYSDVVVVRYHKVTDPESTYLLRFFARDKGLILERYFVGDAGTEIGNLQLIHFEPSNTATQGIVQSNGLQYYFNSGSGFVWYRPGEEKK